MRRILSAFLALLALIFSITPAKAAVNGPDVLPQYTYISKLSAGLAIDDASGLTDCGGSCVVFGGDTVKLTCTLQKYTGSSWTAVKAWSTTSTTSTARINKNYAVYSGYTYRVRITCSVYRSDGLLIESGTCYSNQVEY